VLSLGSKIGLATAKVNEAGDFALGKRHNGSFFLVINNRAVSVFLTHSAVVDE
jgi:hypothetical protein